MASSAEDGQAIALEVIQRLDEMQVPYMVVGSLSSNVYGIPRSTKDADLVLDMQGREFAPILKHMQPLFTSDRQLRFEGITATKRHILKRTGHEFNVELFVLTSDPFDQSRFARRQLRTFAGERVYLPTPEDVIVQKARWLLNGDRPKDREDIAAVLGVRQGTLDWDYIDSWSVQHGTRELLDEIRRSLPPLEPAEKD